MFGATVLTSILAFNPPPGTPPEWSEQPGQLCTPIPPAPSYVDVSYFDDARADGSYVWGAEATYELSTGDLGEMYIVIDSGGAGEAYLAINGNIVAHASVSPDDAVSGGPTAAWWSSPQLNYSAELLAELMQGPAAGMINRMIPQEFKCSPFGKKAVKGAKYAWFAVTGALTAACCGTLTVGCLVCAGGAAAAAGAGADALDEYCE